MSVASYIQGMGRKLLVLLFGCSVLSGCKAIYDDEGDCTVTYRVKFRYDRNLKFADAFASEVETVALYLLDATGKVVWQGFEQGEALKEADYAMTVDVAPGTYDLVAWCGSKTRGSFDTDPAPADRSALTCTLVREHAGDGTACVRHDLDRLYHGYLPGQIFEKADEGLFTYTVPLTKDTNDVRVVLQQLSGEPMDPARFSFRITAENGRMDWDNALLPDERITYHAWHVQSGTAGAGMPGEEGTVTSLSAVIAELTTARLMVRDATPSVRAEADFPDERRMRLTVTDNDTGRTVVRIPLVDYALLVKGENRKDMDNQEFLDRMDEYNLVFILDETFRWVSMSVNINSWKLVVQNSEI